MVCIQMQTVQDFISAYLQIVHSHSNTISIAHLEHYLITQATLVVLNEEDERDELDEDDLFQLYVICISCFLLVINQ